MSRLGRSVRFVGVSALVVALALVGTACGSDDPGPSSSSTTSGNSGNSGNAPAKAAYIKNLNAVCNKRMVVVRTVRAQALAELGANPTPEQIAQVTADVVIAEKRNVLKHMRAVPRPAADERTLEIMFAALKNSFDTQVAALKTNPNPPDSSNDYRRRALAYGISPHCRTVPLD